jgi:thiamine pyrophosphate-dependent acetolactate synthase large subunit-like protein
MSATMKVEAAIAAIIKREGVEILAGYPVNHLIEFAAAVDIRPVIVCQERIGLHMADAISRMTSGRKLGVFCMQHGPRHGECLRRSGASVWRLDPNPRRSGRLPTPGLGE